ncbi:MAG: glycoside hydrolase family 16 protein, partial [Gammaproteobacteria bacterium]
VEIDARMPGTQGTLPSLRLLPAVPGGEVVPNYGPWPQSGEVDIVNAPNLGPSNSSLDHTLIYGLPEPENTSTTANSVAPGLPTVDIIQYAIEWEGGEIRWFVNDVHVATQTQDNWYAYFQDADGNGSFDADGPFTLGTGAAPFDDNFYLVIGLAVGNNADSFFPQTLEIDAVRVYDCANPTDPLLGTGCSTGTGVPAENAPAAPYTEMLEIYTDAPATLDFLEPDGVNTVTATLTPFAFQGDPSVVVSSVPNAPDGGNTVWRVDVQAPIGTFGSALMAADNVSASISSSRYLDLSGGGTAGEILFRMRVNSASAGARLEAGLVDRPDNPGVVSLDFVADGQWRDYSVKIVDIVSNSIAAGPSIDLADIFGVFVAGLDGTVNFDLDDISITVACRDVGGCEATPRAEDSAPPIVVFSEDFESLDASNAAALGPFGAGWQIFADVWDGEVGVPANFKYQYGPFAAPNPGAGPGFSQLINDINECFAGGGTQCLNAFSDYNNQDHGPSGACSPNSCAINTNVLKDLRDLSNPITAADIGLCWTFSGDYKAPGAGGIGGATTANAFITTLDPNDNFAATNVDRFDTTAASNTEFARFSVDVDTADSALIGQLLQIGFNTTATNFEPSGVYYDNLEVSTRAGACPADP